MEEEKKVRLLFSVKYTEKKTFDNTEDLSKRMCWTGEHSRLFVKSSVREMSSCRDRRTSLLTFTFLLLIIVLKVLC